MNTAPCPLTRVHNLLDQLQLELSPAAPGVPQSASPSGREVASNQPYWAACESA